MRILFVSGEVAPFTNKSEIASLVRALPEQLHETGDYEIRIMMPRYGLVSERRNRLHEVIRLSGNEIPVGAETEPLKVKVASIPGIRLQVYFMDSASLFKRKGIFADRNGKVFPDNPKRALFFSRAVIQTTKNLGWAPSVVHSFGWMSGFMPYLLKTEFASDPLFAGSKMIYTPQQDAVDGTLTADVLSDLGLAADSSLLGQDPALVGAASSDAVIRPGSMLAENGTPCLGEDPEQNLELVRSVYNRVLSGITV